LHATQCHHKESSTAQPMAAGSDSRSLQPSASCITQSAFVSFSFGLVHTAVGGRGSAANLHNEDNQVSLAQSPGTTRAGGMHLTPKIVVKGGRIRTSAVHAVQHAKHVRCIASTGTQYAKSSAASSTVLCCTSYTSAELQLSAEAGCGTLPPVHIRHYDGSGMCTWHRNSYVYTHALS
jgi:hypothetical protein